MEIMYVVEYENGGFENKEEFTSISDAELFFDNMRWLCSKITLYKKTPIKFSLKTIEPTDRGLTFTYKPHLTLKSE